MKAHHSFAPTSRAPAYRFGPRHGLAGLKAEITRLENLLVHQQALIENLAQQVERDPLTGLLNRRGFTANLERTLAEARRYGRVAALISLDLNHFKPVNDTHGHAVGDALLQHVARLLLKHTRSTDVVARLGGDEFVVLLPEATAAQANAKAQELARAFRSAPCTVGGLSLNASASLGVATLAEATTSGALLSLADQRMYRAKARAHAARVA